MFTNGAWPVVASMLVVLNACDWKSVPDDVVEPVVVGVVADSEQQGSERIVTLEDGTQFSLTPDAVSLGAAVAEGFLLIAGHGGPKVADDDVWYSGVPPASSGCFDLSANGEVRDGRMALSHGFSLPLSEDWEETETEFLSTPARGFCLNAQGEVVSPNPVNQSP